ncbi:mitochondrial-processing peptidase subunit beta-like [Symsagittifera roscoffensis]|uniref:mitochondrial-processing peptidase subunit beta-like n=1 Tax=Symsagittifera roscoffensis TaxID=84072 RepID=UPI00307C7723
MSVSITTNKAMFRNLCSFCNRSLLSSQTRPFSTQYSKTQTTWNQKNVRSLVSVPANKPQLIRINKQSSLGSEAFQSQLSIDHKSSHEEQTRSTTLDNGLRVVTEDLGGLSACIGLWIDAGSRYETSRNNGVAHFLEHLIFKGTQKRSQYDLEIEVENMGIQLNAYTSREQTVYFGKCQSKDSEKLLEILSDILTNSVLDKGSINRERDVILREMQEVESNLQEVVFDHVHEYAFRDSPLGYTILGPADNIRSINQSMLIDYITTHYIASRIVLVAAGAVDHDEVVQWADKFLGRIPKESPLSWTLQPYNYQSATFGKEVPGLDIANVVFTVEGVAWANPDIIPLMIGNMLIGAWDRGSSNQSANFLSPENKLAAACLNEGLCYSYQSFNTCYMDTGLWGVHFVSGEKSVNRMIEAVCAEWARVAFQSSDEEIERAKRSLKTNLMLQMDGYQPICEEVGRQILCYGRRIPLEEMNKRIDLLTPKQVRDVIAHYALDAKNIKPVVVGVGPVADMMTANDAKQMIQTKC